MHLVLLELVAGTRNRVFIGSLGVVVIGEFCESGALVYSLLVDKVTPHFHILEDVESVVQFVFAALIGLRVGESAG